MNDSGDYKVSVIEGVFPCTAWSSPTTYTAHDGQDAQREVDALIYNPEPGTEQQVNQSPIQAPLCALVPPTS